MNKDWISALAREYAEEVTKADAGDPNLSAADLNGIKHDVAEYVEEVITFLLRRFYLVEKSKVKEEYRAAKECLDKVPTLSIIGGAIHGQIIVLKSLFPEIAKEV